MCCTHCYPFLLFVYFGCAGSVGIFSGGLGHVFSACVTPLCGVPGRYNFIQASVGADGGTVEILSLPGSVVAGTVRLK